MPQAPAVQAIPVAKPIRQPDEKSLFDIICEHVFHGKRGAHNLAKKAWDSCKHKIANQFKSRYGKPPNQAPIGFWDKLSNGPSYMNVDMYPEKLIPWIVEIVNIQQGQSTIKGNQQFFTKNQ